MKSFANSAVFSVFFAAASLAAGTSGAQAPVCSSRTNNSQAKLLECVTVDGVRKHQAALQAAADANSGVRSVGSAGYFDSVLYIANTLEAAGYLVELQPFTFNGFVVLSPSRLEQLAPTPVVYVNAADFNEFSFTAPGNVVAPVVAVDLQFGLGNTSTSGCEPADFAGFPAGSIALLQRGACTFELKAENAAAAGATGAIIFNQGNSPDRLGLISGTLTAAYSGGIPVFSATYARGVEWASTPGLVLSMRADVTNSPVTSWNVIAESVAGDPLNVLMVGAHLDSVAAGPGIQDNGSGSAAILEIAVQMAKVKPVNKVRFAWWGAEENGLVGSTHFVNTLSAEQRSAIMAYLNFDMIGSPNFVRFIYDGDDGVAPAGSSAIKAFFASFYAARGLAWEPTTIFFQTDTAPFINANIAVGGLFTGASGIKTPAEAATYGGVAGVQYDPCYHLACDTFSNISLDALDLNSDAAAAATLKFASVKIKKTKKAKTTSLTDTDYYGHDVRK